MGHFDETLDSPFSERLFGNEYRAPVDAAKPLLNAQPVKTSGRVGAGLWAAFLLIVASVLICPEYAVARVVPADESNYQQLIQTLEPGDVLQLRPGIYRGNLRIEAVHGEPQAPITIAGAATLPATVFVAKANSNTVTIVDSSYVTVRDLVLQGRGLNADAVKCGPHARWAHHVTVENLFIAGYGGAQQIVGISTKCPAWNWVVRGNVIVGAGTGMYFGDSDGSSPFVAGLIEGNVVIDSLGYNLQIKHQNDRTGLPAMAPAETVIRRNTFSKAHHGSRPPLARPNVLLGHLPRSGPGSDDRYVVYGNFFYENPTERLLQAEGNVDVHDNVFVNDAGDAIAIQPHNDIPRRIRIFHNTVVARDGGIIVTAAPGTEVQDVAANLVFARDPLVGGHQMANIIGTRSAADRVLVKAQEMPMDLHPRAAQTVRVATGIISEAPEARCDFDGRPRTASAAGAYVGPNDGASWVLRSDSAPNTRGCEP